MENRAETQSRHRILLPGIELVVAYVFIECALWSSRMADRNRWALVAAIAVLLAEILDRPSVRRMGLSLPTTAATVVLPISVAVGIGLTLLAIWLGGHFQSHTMLGYLYGSGGYLIWALLQEFLLQSFFFTRCEEIFGTSGGVWAAATLFAAAHLPSPILTTFTLVGGLFFCELFRRYRSIYPIAIIHAALGLIIGVTMPESLLHHMRAGIGYLNY